MFGIKKFYKSPLTNYVFGVAMGSLLLKLQNFKRVKLIFGHPVGDPIYDFQDKIWSTEGMIVKKLPYRSYVLKLRNGRNLRRNRKHLKRAFKEHLQPFEDTDELSSTENQPTPGKQTRQTSYKSARNQSRSYQTTSYNQKRHSCETAKVSPGLSAVKKLHAYTFHTIKKTLVKIIYFFVYEHEVGTLAKRLMNSELELCTPTV